jgi:heat shock protein beta
VIDHLCSHLKEDAREYLDADNLKQLILKHSTFSTTAPIYVWADATEEVETEAELSEEDKALDGTDEEKPKVVMKEIKVPKWVQLNDQPPLWMRDPKSISDKEYIEFYQSQYKELEEPLFWSHIKGDIGSTSFRALIYVPANIPNDLFSKSYIDLQAIKLFVRRVFITSDLGPNWIPRWLQFVRIIVDADDLPLNVGRDSLQANKALQLIQRNVIKKTLDLFESYATSSDAEKQKKYEEFWKVAGSPVKLGAHDDQKQRARLMKLVRFPSSQSNATSLDDYISRRRLGQTQIFFAASAGGSVAELQKSPFVEKIVARGYEVLWLLEPVDEMLVNAVATWDSLKFQDVAKKGLKFGDEGAVSLVSENPC